MFDFPTISPRGRLAAAARDASSSAATGVLFVRCNRTTRIHHQLPILGFCHIRQRSRFIRDAFESPLDATMLKVAKREMKGGKKTRHPSAFYFADFSEFKVASAATTAPISYLTLRACFCGSLKRAPISSY